ncbi:MAG: hypothetical protein QF436_03810 [Candidatus Woesearchaeota archaeon]|jgi:ribosomal protein S24E|nr:hypothetical protein [archaeon]MDP6547509.1 hypothetical protein [Candidatus Woesearchaeota archaeon]MDP7263493.1 hypothetical protein [Candidatus Woesearchaeota archaeon]MDP7623212.1 hypothetical protein [Candidatus Woesearchaeota archaeon]HJN56800.1 hypothetical protein [Candidatus Woesearchaeota archaeon]|tara:strand:+ start:36143 stop:36565 length:423 start_codon:yes stop_codon:yes gene_type:complete
MELKIIQKKEEPLLSRTRADAEVSFEKATPAEKEIKDSLVKALGKDEKLIVIRGIYTAYGLKKAKIISYAYENEDSLKRIEIAKKESKEKKPKEAKKETKQEAKKPEAKKEPEKEKKPEVKEEKKEAKEQKPQEKEQAKK